MKIFVPADEKVIALVFRCDSLSRRPHGSHGENGSIRPIVSDNEIRRGRGLTYRNQTRHSAILYAWGGTLDFRAHR